MANRRTGGLARGSRGGGRQWVLRPQDLVVALKLVTLRGQWLPYSVLSGQLQLSAFEVHAAAARLVAARLAVNVEQGVRPVVAALTSFTLYGAPFAYPAVRGGLTIGFPTAHAAPPLDQMVLFSKESPPVWPHPEGPVRGVALLPLYPKLPIAAQADANLYELLALFDALRIGQAREREIAAGLLKERLRSCAAASPARLVHCSLPG